MNASEFKSKCLALLDSVKATGESILILKHGKPVAQINPLKSDEALDPLADLQGSVQLKGDIIESPLPAETWSAERGEF